MNDCQKKRRVQILGAIVVFVVLLNVFLVLQGVMQRQDEALRQQQHQAILAAQLLQRLLPPATASLGGTSIEVRSDDGSTSLNQNAREGASTRASKNVVEIKDGRAIANGQDGGPLKSGDSVLLDTDGRLLVNGEERTTKK